MTEAQALAALVRLEADPRKLKIELTPFEAWVVAATIQLACRHPQFAETNVAPVAGDVARKLHKAVVGDDPVLAELARRGWDAEQDERPMAPRGDA